jgi:hypothetical protein
VKKYRAGNLKGGPMSAKAAELMQAIHGGK